MEQHNTFDFYDSSPLERAQSVLLEIKPLDSPKQKRTIAKKALDITDQCFDAWSILAANYTHFPQQKETFAQALEIAKTQLDEDHILLFKTRLGALHYKNNDLDTAIGHLKNATVSAEACHYLSLCYLHLENYEKAEALTSLTVYSDSLSSRVTQAYLHFKRSMPEWSAQQLDELHHQLLGKTLWQWIHPQCNSLKRLYRSINHQNPFLAAFLLNPRCHEISLPDTIKPQHACEALQVAQDYYPLWEFEGILLQLLEEFPWENPTKTQIAESDKPLLIETISLLEQHREAQRAAAEREYLSEDVFY